jgi:hypothetical protein
MKFVCKECEHEGEPKEVNGGLLCSKCQYPFGYFEVNIYRNKQRADRQASERIKRGNQLGGGPKR